MGSDASVAGQRTSKSILSSGMALVCLLALFKLLLHFCLNGRYGYHGDELYFIACGEHLDLGYVDIGPLTIWLGRLSRLVMGDSLFALRFFPAVAGALTVIVMGLIARALGGGRFAQALAAITYIIAPGWLLPGNILALPSFEPLYWGLCSYILIQIIKTGNTRLWTWFGVVAGLGLLNKPSMAFFGVVMVIGLLLTPQRKLLLDKWIYIGGLVAFIIVLPNLYWQYTHGWATLQFVMGLNAKIMQRISIVEFIAGQAFYYHPFNVAIWIAGLAYYFLAKDGKPYRVLGWIYVFVFLFLTIAKSKIYYLGPAYPMLLAAGARAIEQFIERRNLSWITVAVPGALAAGGLITAPIGLPLLPIRDLNGYVRTMTFGLLKNSYEITGTFRDMFGWEEQVAAVAKVYSGLTPEERANCIIFAGNFSRAGAIDFFGKAYGLPPAVSIHQNYFFWGPPAKDPDVLVAIGISPRDLEFLYAEVEPAATAECPERDGKVPVYVCRKPTASLRQAWPMLRPRAFLN